MSDDFYDSSDHDYVWDHRAGENARVAKPKPNTMTQNAPQKHLPDEWFLERCPDYKRDDKGTIVFERNNQYYNQRLNALTGFRAKPIHEAIPFDFPYTTQHGTPEDWLEDLPAMVEPVDFERWWQSVNSLGWRDEDMRMLRAHYMRHVAVYSMNERRCQLGLEPTATIADVSPMIKGFLNKIERGEPLPFPKYGDEWSE